MRCKVGCVRCKVGALQLMRSKGRQSNRWSHKSASMSSALETIPLTLLALGDVVTTGKGAKQFLCLLSAARPSYGGRRMLLQFCSNHRPTTSRTQRESTSVYL